MLLSRATERTQWIKTPATKTEYLSSVLGTSTLGELIPSGCFLVLHPQAVAYVHMHTKYKNVTKIFKCYHISKEHTNYWI